MSPGNECQWVGSKRKADAKYLKTSSSRHTTSPSPSFESFRIASSTMDEKPTRTADPIEYDEHLHGHEKKEDVDLQHLGYQPELIRTRSLYTILFQSLAIAAVPFGEGTALLSAVIGGGQLAYFVGWIVVCVLDQCVAMSLSELASRFPTASGYASETSRSPALKLNAPVLSSANVS